MNFIAAVVFLAGGGLFVLSSLGILFCQRRFNRTRTPVKLIVVDSHTSTGKGGSYVHLEYKIADGPHAGLRKTSDAGTFPPLHAPGDQVDGYYDTATGDIQSMKEGRLTTWLITGLGGLGGIMLVLGAGLLTGRLSM